MVKHQSKCLLEVTKSPSHNPSDRMIESFTNQTHHNQPSLYQKHMETYCFNTHLNVFFLLTSAPLQFENRLLNTTMALSSKTKRATRMCTLRRYHMPAVETCAMKSLISGRGFLHRQRARREMEMQLHIEFKSDEDAESCLISTKIWSYLLRNRTPYSKKTERENFDGICAFDLANRNSTWRGQLFIRKPESKSSIVLRTANFLMK